MSGIDISHISFLFPSAVSSLEQSPDSHKQNDPAA
jgi:hypothetical protein